LQPVPLQRGQGSPSSPAPKPQQTGQTSSSWPLASASSSSSPLPWHAGHGSQFRLSLIGSAPWPPQTGHFFTTILLLGEGGNGSSQLAPYSRATSAAICGTWASNTSSSAASCLAAALPSGGLSAWCSAVRASQRRTNAAGSALRRNSWNE